MSTYSPRFTSLIPEKIFVYKNDIVVVRIPEWNDNKDRKIAPRGEISEFSYQSRRKLAFVAANTSIVFRTFITLTYPYEWPHDGKQVKKNLRAFLQYLRRVDVDVEYLWFLEFQKRGAPHIHILVNTPVHKFDVYDVSERWYCICAMGDPLHLGAGTRTEAVRNHERSAAYAVKYALKMYQKDVPHDYRNVGRFWGNSQGVKPKLKVVYRVNGEDDLKLYLRSYLRDDGRRSLRFRILYGATEYLNKAVGGIDK